MQGYSQGCFACRRRKVKCDESRPACARCQRRKETCPGYRDHNQWIFRSMNKHLAEKAGHASQPSSCGSINTGAFEYSDLWPPNKTANTHALLMVYQPAVDLEQHAVAYFLHNYVLFPLPGRCGYLEFLPDLFAQCGHELALKHAVHAAAWASFGNVSSLNEAKIKAQMLNRGQKHYGLALRALQHMLNDSKSATSDCSLASIILLQKFEVISGLKNLLVDYHEEALRNLQQSRGEEELMTPIGQQLSFAIRSLTHFSELDGLRSRAPSIRQANVCNSRIYSKGLWRIFDRAVHICRRIRQVVIGKIEQGHVENSTLNHVFDQALQICGELRDRPNVVPIKYQYQTLSFPDSQRSTSAHERTYYTFENVQHGAIWIELWSTEIHLLENMKILAETFRTELGSLEYPDLFESEWLSDRQVAVVNQICGSSPFMLGELKDSEMPQPLANSKSLGAFYLFRGLYTASRLDNITEVQKDFILDRLLYIGHSRGIALALRCRERWLEEQSTMS